MSKKEKKPKSKVRKIVEGILTGITLAILGFVGISLVTGMMFKKHGVAMMFNQIGSCYVLTDSMEPVYPKKTTIIVQKCTPQELIERMNNNEVVDVTFFNSNVTIDPDCPSDKSLKIVTDNVMTHRLIHYYVDNNTEEGQGRYYFYAAGINTGSDTGKAEQYQVFTEQLLIGRVIGKSQFLGLMTQFITSWYGLLILLLIPSFYMIVTSVLDIFKAYKGEGDDEGKVVAEVDGNASASLPPGGNEDVLKELSDEDRERLKQELLDEMLNNRKKGS